MALDTETSLQVEEVKQLAFDLLMGPWIRMMLS